MRDIDRIERMLTKLRLIWEKHPDERFFQLLHNIGFNAKKDHYNVEDDEIEEVFSQCLQKFSEDTHG